MLEVEEGELNKGGRIWPVDFYSCLAVPVAAVAVRVLWFPLELVI